MSVFALNTCQEANGVSWLHGEVSKKMFAGIWKGYAPEESHVGYVTNGVHMPTWAASEWKSFYRKNLDKKLVRGPEQSRDVGQYLRRARRGYLEHAYDDEEQIH